MKKLGYLIIAAGLLGLTNLASAQDTPRLHETTDLSAVAEQAHEQDVPILVVFTQKNCAYCIILEEEYIRPMLKSGDYKNKVIIRKVRIDNFESLTGFDGKPVDADMFAGEYRAYVTPTMVFLDHNGRELTSRLMGIGTEGFFAAEIDDAIDVSLSRLRSVAINQQ
jgi:thioredoxin-related protein